MNSAGPFFSSRRCNILATSAAAAGGALDGPRRRGRPRRLVLEPPRPPPPPPPPQQQQQQQAPLQPLKPRKLPPPPRIRRASVVVQQEQQQQEVQVQEQEQQQQAASSIEAAATAKKRPRSSTKASAASTDNTAQVDSSPTTTAPGEECNKGTTSSSSNGNTTSTTSSSSSVLGRLKLLTRLGQQAKAASAPSVAGQRAAGAAGSGQKQQKKQPQKQQQQQHPPFGGRIEQDRQTGAWRARGLDAGLRALGERTPQLQTRLAAAVRLEQEEAERELRRLYASASLRRLAADGVLLYPLRAAPHSVELGQMVWKLMPARGKSSGSGSSGGGGGGFDLPPHKFRPGDSVMLRRHAPRPQSARRGLRGRGTSSGSGSGSGGSVWSDSDMEEEDEEEEEEDAWSGSGSGYDTDDSGDGGGNGSNNEPRPARVSATVQAVTKKHVLIAMDRDSSDELEAEFAAAPPAAAARFEWRLDAAESDVTARRQLEAIARLGALHDKSHAVFEQAARAALVGCPSAHLIAANIPPLWVRDPAWRADAKAHLAALPNLNASQRRAVATAVTRAVTLWQGPPGTGKTATLIALMQVLVSAARGGGGSSGGGGSDAERWARMGPILACANTNAATDNLLEGLAARGVRVVRVGQPAKVREALRHLSLEALAEATTAGQRAVELRQSSKNLFEAAREATEAAAVGAGQWSRRGGSSNSSSSSSSSAGTGSRDARALDGRARAEWRKAEDLMRRARQQVLDRAEVIVATCSGAGDPELKSRAFRMVVIDEATQATEPATWVPLTRGAQCVVLAGDPRQLPPTIASEAARAECGLDVTLFERLAAAGVEPLLLDTQYRMHPAIAAFPSARFYAGRVRSGVAAAQRPPAAGVAWPNPEAPLALLRVADGYEERAATGSRASQMASKALAERGGGSGGGGSAGASYRNPPEAAAALRAAAALARGGDVATVAVLTPYRAQARLLERALRRLGPDWPCGSGNGNGGSGSNTTSPPPPPRVELVVSSVDAFQGREADAVVFSAVRCNVHGGIGFVADPRRLNVAVTRPRRGLVVVGCPDTLAAGSDDWRAFVEDAQARGAVADAEDVLPSMAEAFGRGVDPFGASHHHH